MLITEEFFKDIRNLSLKKREQIILKLSTFEEEIKKNLGIIRKSTSGFWIIGLGNGVYKFRLNIKDRILFIFKRNRETGKRDIVQFLRYVNHDKQILVGKNIEIDKDFINYENEFLSNENEMLSLQNYNIKEMILDDIPAIVVEDKDLNNHFFKDSTDLFYYVSDEQYEVLSQINNKSIILKGSGGTGKTIVLLNKLLGIKKFNRDNYKRIAYITYTELLTDNVKRLYDIFTKKEMVHNDADFIFIHQLYKNFCNISENNIVSNGEAIQWINKNKHSYRFLRKVNGYEIFSEIRGIIKGYLGLEGKNILYLNCEKRYFIELEEYKNIPKSYSIFSEEEKIELYRFAVNYQKWLDKNNKYDENDLTIKIINKIDKSFEKYDFIVVDEVQDLTEIQLYMISKMVKEKNNIIWAGDFNQIVNPTFFDFSRLSNIYYSENERKMKEYTLTKNFRTTNEIIKFIKRITDCRKKMISGKEEHKESSLRIGNKPIVISPKEYNLLSILKNVSNKMYCAIIVLDEDEKQKLIYMCPECKGRIFTIYEVKGLEYKNIYCCNILSNNYNVWRKIFDENVKNDESKRYYFNLFYVAVSRAREILCIYEDKINNLDNYFFQDCIRIEEVSPENIYTKEKSDDSDVEKEIERLEKSGNYEQANSLRLNNRLSAKEIEILIEFLKKTRGYGCLIYDENDYIKTCIGNNEIRVVDIINNDIKIIYKDEICSKCIYNNFCIISDTDLLNIELLDIREKFDAFKDIVFKINNRIDLLKKEMDYTEKIYCYQAEIYNKFGCYSKAIEYYTSAIKVNEKCLEAYYCRADIFEKIGDSVNSKKDKEQYISLL